SMTKSSWRAKSKNGAAAVLPFATGSRSAARLRSRASKSVFGRVSIRQSWATSKRSEFRPRSSRLCPRADAFMRIAILGAGPAGLYLAYLLKRARPDFVVDVFEQNPPNATFGFGVAFSSSALEFLGAEDPGTLGAISPALQSWRDSVL